MNIQAPEFILSIISEGYKLPLLHTPPRSFTKNNLSAINNSVFVTESILDLLASDRISEFSEDSLHVTIRCPFPLSLLVNVDSSWINVSLTNLSLSKR